jgi:hypothetical protein
MARVRLLARVRLAVGIACVAVAAATLAIRVPKVINSLDTQVSADAYITDGLTRRTTTGDALGIPYTLQVEALATIPKDSTYVLLLPATQGAATRASISPLALETVAPFLVYLLLPSQPASPAEARYVICYGCDLRSWMRPTRWLWQAPGQAIGRVVG